MLKHPFKATASDSTKVTEAKSRSHDSHSIILMNFQYCRLSLAYCSLTLYIYFPSACCTSFSTDTRRVALFPTRHPYFSPPFCCYHSSLSVCDFSFSTAYWQTPNTQLSRISSGSELINRRTRERERNSKEEEE